MLTPEELQTIVETMYPLLDELNAWIIRDVVRRLMACMERKELLSFGASDLWQLQVYQEAAGHYEDLERELKKWLKLSDKEVQQIFEDAGLRAWNADDAFYVAQGFDSMPLLRSENLMRILVDTYQRTNGEIHNFTRTTAKLSEQRFMNVCDKAHLKVMTGAQSYTGAVKEAVEELASKQVEVQYPSGHKDTIETAVLRCVRTGTAQASGNMSIQGMEERGWDVILVSAHLGARYGDGGENAGNHAWWQGKLYSRSGNDPELPPFSLCGYGTGEGLCGWNCRHSFGPGNKGHNPYKGFDAEENKKAYDLSQQQRAMERSIRKTKAELLGYRTAIESTDNPEEKAVLQEAYDKTALSLKRQNAAYNKFCEDNNLKRYDDRLQAAKWNRSEATRAAKAAAREEKRIPNEQARSTFYGEKAVDVDSKYIGSQAYRMKYHGITGKAKVDDAICQNAREVLNRNTGTKHEELVLFDRENGHVIFDKRNNVGDSHVTYNAELETAIESARSRGVHIVALHNHPEGYPPTADDCVSALNHGYELGIVCGHNGEVYTYQPAPVLYTAGECNDIHRNINLQLIGSKDVCKTWEDMLLLYQLMIERR